MIGRPSGWKIGIADNLYSIVTLDDFIAFSVRSQLPPCSAAQINHNRAWLHQFYHFWAIIWELVDKTAAVVITDVNLRRLFTEQLHPFFDEFGEAGLA